MTTGIVITAAGRGERFIQAGGQGNKLNAGFADAAGERRSLFEHTLCQALASGLPVQVVTRPDNLPVLAACAANQVRSPCSPARASATRSQQALRPRRTGKAG